VATRCEVADAAQSWVGVTTRVQSDRYRQMVSRGGGALPDRPVQCLALGDHLLRRFVSLVDETERDLDGLITAGGQDRRVLGKPLRDKRSRYGQEI
jgi:hypothetical protein